MFLAMATLTIGSLCINAIANYKKECERKERDEKAKKSLKRFKDLKKREFVKINVLLKTGEAEQLDETEVGKLLQKRAISNEEAMYINSRLGKKK